jgi:hypothetical protein
VFSVDISKETRKRTKDQKKTFEIRNKKEEKKHIEAKSSHARLCVFGVLRFVFLSFTTKIVFPYVAARSRFNAFLLLYFDLQPGNGTGRHYSATPGESSQFAVFSHELRQRHRRRVSCFFILAKYSVSGMIDWLRS